MKLVYFHGFGSNSQPNRKVEGLAKHHKKATGEDLDVVYFDYRPHRPKETAEQIDSYFSSEGSKFTDTVVMGTSLGGFWAMYAAIKFDLQAFLINPSFKPQETLPVGDFEYFDGSGRGFVSPNAAAEFKLLSDYVLDNHFRVPICCALATDDDFLDHTVALELLRDNHVVIISETGGHRFDYEIFKKEILPTFNSYLYNLRL